MSSAAAKAPTRVDLERLTSLGERFRMWQKRQGRSYFKMPSHLWDDAFAFVPLFGATRVAREIGVSREELLGRLSEEQAPAVASPPANIPAPDPVQGPEFLEIEMEWPGVARPQAPLQPTVAQAPTAAPLGTSAPLVTESAAPASNATSVSAEEAWLEVVASDGDKMTLRIPAIHLASAAALVREFRTQR